MMARLRHTITLTARVVVPDSIEGEDGVQEEARVLSNEIRRVLDERGFERQAVTWTTHAVRPEGPPAPGGAR